MSGLEIVPCGVTWPAPPPDLYVSAGRCRSCGRDITLCYNTFGDASHPCIVLIMGMQCPGPFWDSRFCQLLADAGYYVIRFDNRDSGLSTHLDDVPQPWFYSLALPRWMSPFEVKLPYSIDDMADDVMNMLTGLRIDRAHYLGCSMGGMIAQSILTRHPARVKSVCLLSTSTGMPTPELKVLLHLATAKEGSTPEAYVQEREAFCRVINGKVPFPTMEFREGMLWVAQRSAYTGGSVRQAAAIRRSGDRTAALRQVNSAYGALEVPPGRGLYSLLLDAARAVYDLAWPTARRERRYRAALKSIEQQRTQPFIPVTILHGECDPIIPCDNAEKLTRTIVGSKAVIFPNMGHYFSSAFFRKIAQEVVLTARHGEALDKKR